jgi:predicted porin
MQKKLIALAVASLAAGSVFAQSNVTISGYVSQGYANVKTSGLKTQTNATGAQTDYAFNTSNESRVDDGRYSRIRFTGTEDLGNGLKAEFQIETRFGAEANQLSSFAQGDTFVGLNGGFGRVRLGRMDTFYSDGVLTELTRATSFQDFATLSVLTQVNGIFAVLPSRHSNQIRYDSPNFSGFSGTLAYSTNAGGNEGTGIGTGAADPAKNPGKGGSWYAAARYFAGPIYAGGSFFRQKAEGGLAEAAAGANNVFWSSATAVRTPDVDAWRLYGSYTFPFGLKVGLNVDRTAAKYMDGVGTMKRTAWFVPVTYSFGSHSIYGTYGRAKDVDWNGGWNNTGAKFYKLAYDYALSKRTSIGANYTVLDNDSSAAYTLFLSGSLTGNGAGGYAASQATGLTYNTTTGALGGTATVGNKQSQLYIGIAHAF